MTPLPPNTRTHLRPSSSTSVNVWQRCWLRICTTLPSLKNPNLRPQDEIILELHTLDPDGWGLRYVLWCCCRWWLRIMMMVLVPALCYELEKWLGLHQRSVSLTDGNTRSWLTAVLTAHSQRVSILHSLYALFVALAVSVLFSSLFTVYCSYLSETTRHANSQI